MNKQKILKELVDHLFEFDRKFQTDTDYTMADFVGYLNIEHQSQPSAIRNLAGMEQQWVKQSVDAHTEIATLLVFMYRYAVVYFKKALKGGTINTLDEFSFLIVLITYPSLTKTELIQKLIMEKTSGMEVLKRLLKQGLIREFANPNDKRSVLIAITETGKHELKALLPKMGMVGNVVKGNLSSAEVSSLSYLLRKLDSHHNEIFLHQRNSSLEKLAAANSQQCNSI